MLKPLNYLPLNREDTTDTGHILGNAGSRNISSFPERFLRRPNCAVMKLLLHMAMYIGANSNRIVRFNIIFGVNFLF